MRTVTGGRMAQLLGVGAVVLAFLVGVGTTLSAKRPGDDGCLRPTCQNNDQCNNPADRDGATLCQCGPDGGATNDFCYYVRPTRK